MSKRGINNDGDLGALVLGHQGCNSLVKLSKAGLGPALGRNIRPVDDDVLGHLFIEPLTRACHGAIRCLVGQVGAITCICEQKRD